MINDVAHYRYYLLLLLVHSAILLFSSAFSATAMNGGAHHSSLLTTETSSSDDDITNTATLITTTTTMSVEQTQHGDKQKTPHRRRRYYSPFLPLPTDNNNDRQPSLASALIILNTPISTTTTTTDDNNNNQLLLLPEVFQRLWESTSFHVCADGGANRLYDATIKRTHRHHDNDDIVTTTTDSKFLPDLITGDLDSLRPNVKSYYEQRGVPIVTVQDQNYHDLDKSLMAVEQWIMTGVEINNKNKKQERQHDNYSNKETDTTTTTTTTTTTPTTNCFIYGGFGGRFDQEMACINTLYSWGKKESFQNTQMSIYNEETGVILLSSEGKKPPMMIVNEIWIRFPDVVLLEEEGNDNNDNNNKDSEQNEEEEEVAAAAAAEVGEGPTCGLIPIGGRCETVYTSGLKWNLNGDIPLEFGGLVSSSNRIVDKVVTVMTSSPLLFSFEIVKRYKKNV